MLCAVEVRNAKPGNYLKSCYVFARPYLIGERFNSQDKEEAGEGILVSSAQPEEPSDAVVDYAALSRVKGLDPSAKNRPEIRFSDHAEKAVSFQ